MHLAHSAPFRTCSYLLHPFAVGTSLARSTIVFNNFFIALAVSSALEGEISVAQAHRASLELNADLMRPRSLPPLLRRPRRRRSLTSGVLPFHRHPSFSLPCPPPSSSCPASLANECSSRLTVAEGCRPARRRCISHRGRESYPSEADHRHCRLSFRGASSAGSWPVVVDDGRQLGFRQLGVRRDVSQLSLELIRHMPS